MTYECITSFATHRCCCHDCRYIQEVSSRLTFLVTRSRICPDDERFFWQKDTGIVLKTDVSCYRKSRSYWGTGLTVWESVTVSSYEHPASTGRYFLVVETPLWGRPTCASVQSPSRLDDRPSTKYSASTGCWQQSVVMVTIKCLCCLLL